MKYKIAICDDSEADRQYIMNRVNRWAAAGGHVIQTDSFTSAENFLFRYPEESDFDILLLDIEMGQMNGVDLAKTIRRINDAIQIIFVTGFPDFMAEGYEVSALHYLMKPVSEEKLFAVLDKAASNLAKAENGCASRSTDRQTETQRAKSCRGTSPGTWKR